MEAKLFINKRYVNDLDNKYTMYLNRSGVIKKVVLSPLLKKVINEKDIWYDLDELPIDLQNQVKDMAISIEELREINSKGTSIKKGSFMDSEEVMIYVSNDTYLLPIVGNFIPNDGVNAYTVICSKETNYIPKLKPIIVCWNCHWSELFTGQTSYGDNVFCLASELTKEQREIFSSEIITLEDAAKSLGLEVKDKSTTVDHETKKTDL